MGFLRFHSTTYTGWVAEKPRENIATVQGELSGQTLAFVDFDCLSSGMFPRCCASSATFAAAKTELGRQ